MMRLFYEMMYDDEQEWFSNESRRITLSKGSEFRSENVDSFRNGDNYQPSQIQIFNRF